MKRSTTGINRIALSLTMLGALSVSGCSAFSGVDPNSPVACVSRDGSCFDVVISGVPVEPLSSESKELISSYLDSADTVTSAHLRYVKWETKTPVAGELVFSANHNYRGSVWFGSNAGLSEPNVESLDGATLKYDYGVGSSAPGHAGGAAVLTKRLAQSTLPSGNYLVEISYVGRKNWDQKYILVRAK